MKTKPTASSIVNQLVERVDPRIEGNIANRYRRPDRMGRDLRERAPSHDTT